MVLFYSLFQLFYFILYTTNSVFFLFLILGLAEPQCSMPKCEEPCHINYNSKPCPACDCGDGMYF